MRSMTGFGCGEAELDGNKLTCELRALNHRFLDVRVRMPEELLAFPFTRIGPARVANRARQGVVRKPTFFHRGYL